MDLTLTLEVFQWLFFLSIEDFLVPIETSSCRLVRKDARGTLQAFHDGYSLWQISMRRQESDRVEKKFLL